MCIAILKPKGQTLVRADLKEAWVNNDDGGGFMYSDGSKLIIRKGYMKFANFWKAYKKLDLEDCNVVVHFRIKTHGPINQANCHPHLVHSDLAVAHNGIFSANLIPIKEQAYSDTVHFCRMLKERLSASTLQDKETTDWIRKVSVGSKLVFMDALGEYQIINEASGTWVQGVWYSNQSFLYPMSYVSDPWVRQGGSGEWVHESSLSDDSVDRCSCCSAPLVYATEVQYDLCQECSGMIAKEIRLEHELHEECAQAGEDYPEEHLGNSDLYSPHRKLTPSDLFLADKSDEEVQELAIQGDDDDGEAAYGEYLRKNTLKAEQGRRRRALHAQEPLV